ncbi:YopX family protein [Pseudotamlana carrageenivorans]|nr:YopX family protein [Tamlana carrageenivorans]
MIYRALLPYDCEHKDIKVMQFTGFKDCKGVDIYEGDILTSIDIFDKSEQVYWCETYGGWMLDMTDSQDQKDGTVLGSDLEDFQFYVSGNIYENK